MSSDTRFWRKSAAPVAAALIGLGAYDSQALSLGKVKVQSALGQSLQAEIDISDLSEEDAKSIKSTLASPAAFTGMGLEYNAALNGTQIALQRRPNGNRFLKLVSSRPLNDPFIDLVVELTWASGRIVRTYTLLLDPPRSPDSTAPTLLPAPSGEAASGQISTPSASVATSLTGPTSSSTTPLAPAPIASKTPAVQSASNSSQSDPPERKTIRVGKGDTAGSLARSMVPEGVSVEQMLVAMLNSNPKAFIGGNVNRLRAGVAISVPEATVALKTSQADARQILSVQHKAFQSMRRSLATQAPTISTTTTSQEAVGSLEKSAATPAPKEVPSDTLKLSKDSVQNKSDKDSVEQIAKQRAKAEASERAAELAKNIEELNQLAKVAAKPTDAAPTTTAPAAPANQSSSPSDNALNTPPASLAKPAVSGEVAADVPDVELRNQGLIAALVALLGFIALRLLRRAKRSKSAQGANRKDDVSQWETNANTNFDAVGGQRIDTADGNTAGLVTTVYPDSQMDIGNELDPVAEAEVYLAYGKDVPAEEILREGLQQDPTRVAIHLKLLGIFAKRADIRSFESMAQEVAQIVEANSSEWSQVQEMGKSIDPSNPLYGQPAKPPQEPKFEPSIFSLDVPNGIGSSGSSYSPAVAVAVKPDGKTAVATTAGTTIANKSPSQTAVSTDFDLTSISLNQPSEVNAPSAQSGDRLDATLALAEQFMAIDEKDGARALLKEVIADGSESLRQRAKVLLAKLK